MSPMPTKHECELLKLRNIIATLEGTLENTQDDNVAKEGEIVALEAELEKCTKLLDKHWPSAMSWSIFTASVRLFWLSILCRI